MDKKYFLVILVAVAIVSMILGAVGAYVVVSVLDEGEDTDQNPEVTASPVTSETQTYTFSTVEGDFSFELTGDYEFDLDALMLTDEDGNNAYIGAFLATDFSMSNPGLQTLSDYAEAATANQCTGIDVKVTEMMLGQVKVARVIDDNDCGNSDTGTEDYYQYAYVRFLGEDPEYVGIATITTSGFDTDALAEMIETLRAE